MKRFVTIIVALLLVVSLPVTIFLVMRNQELRKKATPATSLSLSPTTVTKNVGEEFTLDVRMDTAENQIVATEIIISYDPTVLRADWIHNGTMFPNILSSGTIEEGTVSIALGATNTTTPIVGTGTVATVKFTTLGPTTSPVSIRFTQDTFVGSLGEGSTNALVSSIPATVTINEGTGTGTGTGTTITPTPTLSAGTGGGLDPTPTLAITPTEAAGASDSASASAVVITSPGNNQSVSTTKPTIAGKAPAGSTVTIAIYSDPITVTVQADANGNWSYALDEALEEGPHTIVVAAQEAGSDVTHTATLAFVVASNTGTGDTTADTSPIPVTGTSDMLYVFMAVGALFILTGLAIPAFRRDV